MSINVEYNNKEIVQTVLENIFKMLERRDLLSSWKTEYNKIDDFTKSIYEVILKDKTKRGIYLINTKITSIVAGTPLDDYLSNNLDIHKIIIAKSIAKKVVKQIVADYKNAEFFFENEMLEDIPSKIFIPKHELLNAEMKEELLNKVTITELSKILLTDMMSRYYGAKINDIFRIERPSFTAGKNIFYRRVVNGSWDILFAA